MLNIFICEDNPIERNKIEKIIKSVILIENLDMKMTMSTENPNSIIQYLAANNVSGLYFLDIDLKNKINGLSLAEQIREYDPRGFIVFITTHAEMSYLTFIYKVEAMDFIIKDNFQNIGQRISQCILNANKKLSTRATNLQRNLSLKVNDKIISVDFNEIIFFETSTTIHKIILHCTNRQIEFYSKMKDIEEKLDGRFYRCHRSYLINKNNIEHINKNDRTIKMTNGEECLISTRSLKGLIENLQNTAS